MSASDAMDYGVITFDGPAASGKSSVAQRVARRLAIPFVSSGLLYRAATYAAQTAGADLDDATAVLHVLSGHDVLLEPGTDGNRIVLDGSDVSAALHTDAVDAGVSQVAAHPGVRAWVSRQLQRVAPPFAIDGRDMGSVVFPQATHKFYLTASPHERARRRVGERSADLAAVEAAIARRDRLDAKQLVPAPDACHVDTDGLALDQVVARVLERLGLEAGGRA